MTTTPDSQISIRFALRLILFELQATWHKHQMTPKWTCTVKSQRYPTYIQQLPPSSKFHSVSLYPKVFSSYMPFRERCIEWPENDMKKNQRFPIYIWPLPPIPNVTLFHSMYSRYRVTGHSETTAPNDPNMTFDTKRSKVPHIHVTTSDSQINPLSLYNQPIKNYMPFWPNSSHWSSIPYLTTPYTP